jgi:hypothetical protein
MLELDEITPLEQEGYSASPEKLGEAFELLSERWSEGARDRETALRLLFLTWYNCADPRFLPDLEPPYSIEELFQYLGGESSGDGEFLYSIGIMAELFPYCCGPESLWQARAGVCLARSSELLSGLPRADQFVGRGAYGLYFEHIVRTS